MRRYVGLTGLVVAVIGIAIAAVAQSPDPPPALPTTPTVPTPKGLVSPALAGLLSMEPAKSQEPPGSAALARFDPLVAFPDHTQSAVRAVLLGAGWMTRVNQAQGRFLYGYYPALRHPMMGDHDLKQAMAALGMARAARFSGDDKQRAIASQAVLALLAATRVDPADATCRVPVHSSILCNRVGFAATLALAIHELPAVDATLVAEADKLCTFLRRQCRANGSIHYTDGPNDDPQQIDPAGGNEYPGLALQAIAASHRAKPEAWKAEAVQKGIAFYRSRFQNQPHPMLAATLSPVCAEFHSPKTAEATAALFKMNDWLCNLQIKSNDARTPQWAGGFRSISGGQLANDPPGPETGLYLEALACAYNVTRQVPDLAREARYKAAAIEACRFTCGLQYLEANTRHFENAFRANMLIGGFHLSPTDGNLRIDATAATISGLLRFLSSGAEK